MKKSILLCAALCLLSAPALAQAPVGGPVGGSDRTLGNGDRPSMAPGVPNARSRRAVTNPSATGGSDGTLGNGDRRSQAVNQRTMSTGSTTKARSRQSGGSDGTLGNGDRPSQR